jgi:hypothetical protein
MRVTNGIPLGSPLLTVVAINYVQTLKAVVIDNDVLDGIVNGFGHQSDLASAPAPAAARVIDNNASALEETQSAGADRSVAPTSAPTLAPTPTPGEAVAVDVEPSTPALPANAKWFTSIDTWLHPIMLKPASDKLLQAGETLSASNDGRFLIRKRGNSAEFILCLVYLGRITQHLITRSAGMGYLLVNKKYYGESEWLQISITNNTYPTTIEALVAHLVTKPQGWPVQMTEYVNTSGNVVVWGKATASSGNQKRFGDDDCNLFRSWCLMKGGLVDSSSVAGSEHSENAAHLLSHFPNGWESDRLVSARAHYAQWIVQSIERDTNYTTQAPDDDDKMFIRKPGSLAGRAASWLAHVHTKKGGSVPTQASQTLNMELHLAATPGLPELMVRHGNDKKKVMEEVINYSIDPDDITALEQCAGGAVMVPPRDATEAIRRFLPAPKSVQFWLNLSGAVLSRFGRVFFWHSRMEIFA